MYVLRERSIEIPVALRDAETLERLISSEPTDTRITPPVVGCSTNCNNNSVITTWNKVYKTNLLMDYIHCPVSSIDHDVSETGCLRPQADVAE
jgi:hypothetical protein